MHRAIVLSFFAVSVLSQTTILGAGLPGTMSPSVALTNTLSLGQSATPRARRLSSADAYAALQLSTNQSGSSLLSPRARTSISNLSSNRLSSTLQTAQPQAQLRIQGNTVLGQGAGHTVSFASNLHTDGSVDVRMPDGQRLRSHPLAICYYIKDGPNVLIASLKDCTAEILGPPLR